MRCEACKEREASKKVTINETVFQAVEQAMSFWVCFNCYDYLLGVIKRFVGRK